MTDRMTFSDEWHQFYNEFVLRTPENRHIFSEIEEKLVQYESVWGNQTQYDNKSYNETNPEAAGRRLEVAASNIELLQRVILCRSIHLIRGFIGAINRDDFDSAPFLLRAVMEEAALGFHAVKRVRNAIAVLRRDEKDEQTWENLLRDAQLSALFGAKLNFGAIVKEVQERLARGEEVDYAVEEVEIVRELIEQGRLSEKAIQADDLPFKSKNIIDMVRDLSDNNPQESAPPNAIELEWAYFSQYCHPSGFAWSFDVSEIFAGGRDYDASMEVVDRRRKAFACFIEPMWEWVLDLPLQAMRKLEELRFELEREADALGSSP